MFKSKTSVWVLAIVITLLAAYYQKTTGPTYPKKEKISINGVDYKLKLTRSSSLDTIANVFIDIADKSISAQLHYRRYPGNGEWITTDFREFNDGYIAFLPNLGPAGKWEYFIKVYNGDEVISIAENKTVKIRYKGAVPAYILIPHILFIFLGMLIANLTGLMVIFKHKGYKFYLTLTLILITLGGMVFGPIVQKFAFGDYWTGVPFGWDLTDNKMLIAFIAWLIAYLGNIKKERPYLALLAAITVLGIFSIPHSMFGSELNPETGEIIQAAILFLVIRKQDKK